MEGNVVISVGLVFGHSGDTEAWAVKDLLNDMHRQKIGQVAAGTPPMLAIVSPINMVATALPAMFRPRLRPRPSPAQRTRHGSGWSKCATASGWCSQVKWQRARCPG